MSGWDDRTLIEDLLANGVDDWVYAAWVQGVAQRSGLTDSAMIRQLSIGVIAEVLVAGLMVAGDVIDGKHHTWNSTPADSLRRITAEWTAVGEVQLYPGQIVWLCNTAEGNERGQAVLDRETEE